jgi:hypothetical protein
LKYRSVRASSSLEIPRAKDIGPKSNIPSFISLLSNRFERNVNQLLGWRDCGVSQRAKTRTLWSNQTTHDEPDTKSVLPCV